MEWANVCEGTSTNAAEPGLQEKFSGAMGFVTVHGVAEEKPPIGFRVQKNPTASIRRAFHSLPTPPSNEASKHSGAIICVHDVPELNVLGWCLLTVVSLCFHPPDSNSLHTVRPVQMISRVIYRSAGNRTGAGHNHAMF